MSNSYLERLFGSDKVEECKRNFLSNTPFVIHDVQIDEINQISFLSSIESLFSEWSKEVDVHLPEISDEADSITVDTKQAQAYFSEGMGLLFNDIDRESETLTRWAQVIKAELGLSQMTYARSLAYVTAKGKGTAAHFDQNINFVLQLTGQKDWWIAPNDTVENPLTRHTLGLPIDPELASYTTKEMPLSFPEQAQKFTLKPGSLLFVPRGAWHKTHALSDALSLNFTYSAPTWLDLFGAAMRGRLAMSSEWRETATFMDENGARQAEAKFNALLAELSHESQFWKAADILSVTE